MRVLSSTFPRWGLAVALSILLAAAVAAPAAGQGLQPPAIAWQPCGEDFPGVECATAEVPLDYDAPTGTTTQIALARVPAGDSANRVGRVFVNPGGRGVSGVGLVLGRFGGFLHANLDGRFDVVGVRPARRRRLGSSSLLRQRRRPRLVPLCHAGDVIAEPMSTADVARTSICSAEPSATPS